MVASVGQLDFFIHIDIYIYIYIHTHICLNVLMHIYIYIHTHTYDMHACMHACISYTWADFLVPFPERLAAMTSCTACMRLH